MIRLILKYYWGFANNKHETLFENSHTYILQNLKKILP
jgi:hypothetical protein